MNRYIVSIGYITIICAISASATAHDIYNASNALPDGSFTAAPNKSVEYNPALFTSSSLDGPLRKKRVRVIQPLPRYTKNLSVDVLTTPNDGEVVGELKFYSQVYEYERRGDWVRISANGKKEKWVKSSGLDGLNK